MNATTSSTEAENNEGADATYFQPARLIRICSACEVLSWFALVLGAFTLLAGLWVLVQPFLGSHISLSNFMASGSPLVVLFGLGALICFFFWVFLRALAEGLYLLMDIQEGLRGRLPGTEDR